MLQYIKNKFSSHKNPSKNLDIPMKSQKIIDIHDDIFSCSIFLVILTFFFRHYQRY